MTSFSYAKPIANFPGSSVANVIGYALSHETFNPINNIDIQTESIKNQLEDNRIDSSFKFKSAFLYNYLKDKKQLHVTGSVLHTDGINRHIQTKFDAFCTLENEKLIIIDSVKLKNITKPRVVSFLVPASAIHLKTFKDISFVEALQQVQSVAKRVDNFDIVMDLEVQDYIFIAFIMNKINESDSVITVMSDTPYSNVGEPGQLIKTRDNWFISSVQNQFAYSNFQPRYFNVLWETESRSIPIASYSTYGLVKEIQVALVAHGYNVGILNGRLNTETKTAIADYIKTHKFHPDTKISTALLWFMQQNTSFDIPKVVQAALLSLGENVGSIDGKTGSRTIRGITNYQKILGVKQDGKISPELVFLLIYAADNVDTYRIMNSIFSKPIFLKSYQEKKWPNQI